MTPARNALARATVVISMLVLAGLGWLMLRSQAGGEQELVARFQIRAEIGSQFLAGYAEELLARERAEGTAQLSGDVTAQQFTRFSRALGFPAAVLLDSTGRLLAVEPSAAALIGKDVGAKYAHLEAALKGHVTVSNVVASAARAVPVVGFAVPIDVAEGRRVLSGALSIANTTLGSTYLRSIVPLAGARAYLVDQNAATIASSLAGLQTADLMQQHDLPLWNAIAAANRGRYEGAEAPERFAVARVENTPWRLVLSVPEAALLAPLAGLGRWIPWVILAALCLAAAVVRVQSRRLASSRALQFAGLEKLSLTDTLTGLYNRRGHEFLAAQVLRSSARDKSMVAIVYVDLDGLKEVNDARGHDAGDRMLLRAAALFRRTFREADVIARMGGDEFCIVGAVAGPAGEGHTILQRLEQNRVRDNATCPDEPALAISIGITWWDPREPRPLAALVHEADSRMYEDKQHRRIPAVA